MSARGSASIRHTHLRIAGRHEAQGELSPGAIVEAENVLEHATHVSLNRYRTLHPGADNCQSNVKSRVCYCG